MRDGTNYYHVRSEEIRAVAAGILDPKERARIVQIADDYEKLAGEETRKRKDV
jgi:hypothetical protein